jgi:hypothetical protein
MIEGLTLRLESRERRQERGVDVENAIGKGIEELGPNQAHETSKAHESDVVRLKNLNYRAIVGIPVLVITWQNGDGLDSSLARTLQAGGLRSIRDDDGNRGVKTAVRDRIDDRLEIGASARDENTKASVHDGST